ncbi:MAG: STAS domain-containing protein [Treponema sp.]|uniref:STAS domain-containing protein n=1 Tax=Treponema sp. TaxID=166 RepID=UPI001B48B169|nr:STAS domain-containing protein [Treponema sp.]MBP5402560.1 STAS domain-containing protein [Treponema sp.]MBR5933855.1 STAS domain-containing protein [Treponema sp.]
MSRKKTSGSNIHLTEAAGIEQAASIKQQIFASLKDNKTTIVDLAGLTDIDSSIMQIFISAKLEADSLKKKFFVQNISDEIKNLLQMMSLTLPEEKSEDEK